MCTNIPLSSSMKSSKEICIRLWKVSAPFQEGEFAVASPEECKSLGVNASLAFVASSPTQSRLRVDGLLKAIFRIVLPASCRSSSQYSCCIFAASLVSRAHLISDILQQLHLLHGRCFFICAKRPTIIKFSVVSVVSRYCLLG